MNDKTVVWVVGTSASGKETFARRTPQDTALIAQLGWKGKRVTVSAESLEHLAQFPDDPVTLKRERILQEVPLLLEDHDVVLLKWQFVDSDADRIVRLQDELPTAKHEIIVLHAAEEDLAVRLPRKSWWKQWGSNDFAATELALVADAVESLSAHHDVTHLHSGAEEGYRPYQIPTEQLIRA